MLVACTSLKAQEVAFELYPGWTWISYPSTDTIDFSRAFGSFTPAAGDYIKSQLGYAEYYDGYGWFGTLTNFLPCKGYMYKSNRTEPVMVIVNTPFSRQAVTTAEPTDVTVVSAVVGSNVTISEDNHIYTRGVCWGTEPMPDVDSSHTTDAIVTGSQTVTLDGLAPSTTYYVRAYVVTDYGLFYGEALSFTTESVPTYVVNVSSNPTQGGVVTGGGTYEQGQSCTVQATAKTGYTFTNWTKDGIQVSTEATYSFTVTEDVALVANFTNVSPTYAISVSANPINGGTVSGGGTYYYGNTCTLTATPATGYTFINWTKDDVVVSSNISFTFTVTEDAAYVANFSINSYEITATSNPIGAGTITGVGTYTYGASATLTATPATGYIFTNWTKNGIQVSTEASYSFTVTENVTLVANFTAVPSTCTISVSANPSNGGTVSGGGTYNYGSTCTLTATPAIDYAFTSWKVNGNVVSSNAVYTFTVTSDRTLVANFYYVGGDDHTCVDLGLPSGTLWATCNVGADSPEEFGDYFAWGETQPKDTCDWDTYQFYNGNNLTKYTGDDGLVTLLPEDDAATANWGPNWRMPTRMECQELLAYTTVTWTTQNGVEGKLFTAQNGNSIFLPATGFLSGGSIYYIGSGGYCWSSSLYMDDPSFVWTILFGVDYYMVYCYGRAYGRSVRPVRSVQN